MSAEPLSPVQPASPASQVPSAANSGSPPVDRSANSTPVSAPAAVSEVRAEIVPSAPDTWQPASYGEWEARERAQTFLTAWSEQMTHERSLRSFTARWIFALIVVQVIATFLLVVAQGAGWLKIDVAVLKVLIPSVLAEVFGLGFLVTKYLFSQPLRHGLDTLVHGSKHGI